MIPPAAPLRLARSARAALLRRARAARPREACGVLIGRAGPEGTVVEAAPEAANLADRPCVGFDLSPADWVAAEDRARGAGQAVVGFWHSHPRGPAVPSAADRTGAQPGYSCLIVGVPPRGGAELRSWRLVEGAFAEEPISLPPRRRRPQ